MKSLKLTWIVCFTVLYNLSPLITLAQDFDEINDQADKEYLSKNYQKAIELSTRAINLKTNARSYFIRADSRFSLYDYEAALDDFNKALDNYSNYYSDNKYKGRLYYWRARCKQQLKNYTEAITDFDLSISNNYEEAGFVYWNRANCYYALYKYKKSDEDYAKAIDMNSESVSLAKLYKYRGDCNAKLFDYAKADQFYTRSIKYKGDEYRTYWARGFYRDMDLKRDEAIIDYTKAISIIEASGTNDNNDDLAILYRNLALLYIDNSGYDNALVTINKSLLANPNYIEAFKTRADIYHNLKYFDKAKADYDNAILLVNDNKAVSNLYFDRSYKLDWKILDYKSALEDQNKSIALDPGDGLKFWYRAITYGYKKDYPKALADCNKAIQMYGDRVGSGLYSLRASLKEKSGDYKGAVSDYQAAIKLDNNNARTYYELGRLFKTKLKNDDLAQLNLSKAIEISKTDTISATESYAKVINGQVEEAVSLLLDNVEKFKDNTYQYKWHFYNAACIYALSGNKTKALEYLDKAMAAGFNDYNHLVNDGDLVTVTMLPQYKMILTKYKVPQPKW